MPSCGSRGGVLNDIDASIAYLEAPASRSPASRWWFCMGGTWLLGFGAAALARERPLRGGFTEDARHGADGRAAPELQTPCWACTETRPGIPPEQVEALRSALVAAKVPRDRAVSRGGARLHCDMRPTTTLKRRPTLEAHAQLVREVPRSQLTPGGVRGSFGRHMGAARDKNVRTRLRLTPL